MRVFYVHPDTDKVLTFLDTSDDYELQTDEIEAFGSALTLLAEAGDKHATLASVAGLIEGRQYVMRGPNGQEYVTLVSVDGNEVEVEGEGVGGALLYEYPAGSEFVEGDENNLLTALGSARWIYTTENGFEENPQESEDDEQAAINAVSICQMSLSATQTIPAGSEDAETLVELDASDVTGGDIVPDMGAHKIAVAKPGWYHVIAHAEFAEVIGDAKISFAIAVNGEVKARTRYWSLGGTVAPLDGTAEVSAMLFLAAGDELTLTVKDEIGQYWSDKTILGDEAGLKTWMSVALVRA